jgi:hypothetical protein
VPPEDISAKALSLSEGYKDDQSIYKKNRHLPKRKRFRISGIFLNNSKQQKNIVG